MRAAKGPDLEAMQVLLDAGADVSLGMTKGSNAVMILAGTRGGPGTSSKGAEALHLLMQHGADINAPDSRGDQAIHAAAQQGANDMVRLLVELGANPSAPNGSGKTALDLVTQPGRNHHDDTAEILRELAAKNAPR
jgi:ankyrin repeat protein